MKFPFYGKKLGMTQIFDQDNNIIPTTLIILEPLFLLKKTIGNNQCTCLFATLRNKLNHLVYFKKYFYFNCFKNLNPTTFLQITNLPLGKLAFPYLNEKFFTLTGYSRGRGNLGNRKRNHFTRGPMSHGSKHHALQGSLGAGTTPGRVFPGKKMPGRSGHKKCTLPSLLITAFNNILLFKGSLPGKTGTLITIKPTNSLV